MFSNNDCEKKGYFSCVVLSQMICEQRFVMVRRFITINFELLSTPWVVDNFMDILQDNVEVDLYENIEIVFFLGIVQLDDFSTAFFIHL